MKYIISINSDYWRMRFKNWDQMSAADKHHYIRETQDDLVAFMKKEPPKDAAAILFVNENIEVVEIDDDAEITIQPL